MPNTGCGFPINAAVMCGEWSVLSSAPFLCPACQRGRAALTNVGLHRCEGCGKRPASTDGPYLCQPCREEYDRDLAAEDVIEGDAGSRCSSGCGYCGRCGGA